MLARLQKYFPDLWQRIYVTALLRALREPYFRRLQVHYETSFLAHAFPGIAFTPQQNANFLQSLGRRRTAIAQFMKEDVNRSDVFILFDGHRLITSSKTMELAELGYDSKRRYMPQINLLYVYSLGKNSAAPVYYKQFLGSTPDVGAFPNILQECGISSKDYMVIADKGFASEEDFDELTRLGLQYVIPIKRGSRIVAECLPLNPGCYTDVFTYNDRAIQAFKIEKDGFNVFVFFDAQLYANKLADAVARANKNNETRDQKIQMEQKRRNKGQEAWLFLNYLSSCIGMECLADIARLGEDKNISFEDLRQTFGRIMASKVNGQWSVSPVKSATQKLMNKLQFTIEDADLEALLQKDAVESGTP